MSAGFDKVVDKHKWHYNFSERCWDCRPRQYIHLCRHRHTRTVFQLLNNGVQWPAAHDISVIKANEPHSHAKKANDHNNDHNYSNLHHNTVYYFFTKRLSSWIWKLMKSGRGQIFFPKYHLLASFKIVCKVLVQKLLIPLKCKVNQLRCPDLIKLILLWCLF